MKYRPETFALLLSCLVTTLTLPLSVPAHSQSRTLGKVVIKVTLKDNEQTADLVQDFGLVVKKLNSGSPETVISAIRVKTTSDGSVSLSLIPGDYIVESEKPLVVNGKSYEWSVKLKVELGSSASLELGNDDATITEADAALKRGRIVDEDDLLNVLRDGVVNVQGELTHGTGFIVDRSGLILTNQHVIAKTKELRIQFDGGRKLAATLAAEDSEIDLAVLWVNLSACPSCKSLALAEPKIGTKAVIDGAPVFTISSSLDQNKTLTAGKLRKTDKGAINPDFKIESRNSGAPLFNTVGEVIGVLKFVDQSGTTPGASAVIGIDDAQALLTKAGQVMKEADAPPSAESLPTEPPDSFPEETLKNQVDVKKFKPKPYEAEMGKYQLTIITPVLKYYIKERNRIESERLQRKTIRAGRLPCLW